MVIGVKILFFVVDLIGFYEEILFEEFWCVWVGGR